MKAEEKLRKEREHEEYTKSLEEEEKRQRERMAEVEGREEGQEAGQEEDDLGEEREEEEEEDGEEAGEEAPELVVVDAKEVSNNENIKNLATDMAESMFSSNSSDRPSRSQDSRSPDVKFPSDGTAADGETPCVGDGAPRHGSTC